MTPDGFPHSDTSGSKPACGSPELIAAYRVLRRLSAPRHPPCTLSSLTKLVGLETLSLVILGFSANPIASNPIQLSKTRDPFAGIRARVDALGATRPRIPALVVLLAPAPLVPARDRPKGLVELIGIEPTASALQGRRSPN